MCTRNKRRRNITNKYKQLRKIIILIRNARKNYQPGLEEEIIGLLYEKIYILTKEDQSMKDYNKQVQEEISEIGTKEVKIAHEIADSLIKENYKNMIELSQKVTNKIKK